MKPFALLINYEVIEFVSGLTRKEQVWIWKRLLQIRDYPYNSSDYTEIDPLGRQIHISVSTKYAIKYWIDGADKQIKIMEIRLSDRAL